MSNPFLDKCGELFGKMTEGADEGAKYVSEQVNSLRRHSQAAEIHALADEIENDPGGPLCVAIPREQVKWIVEGLRLLAGPR